MCDKKRLESCVDMSPKLAGAVAFVATGVVAAAVSVWQTKPYML